MSFFLKKNKQLYKDYCKNLLIQKETIIVKILKLETIQITWSSNICLYVQSMNKKKFYE